MTLNNLGKNDARKWQHLGTSPNKQSDPGPCHNATISAPLHFKTKYSHLQLNISVSHYLFPADLTCNKFLETLMTIWDIRLERYPSQINTYILTLVAQNQI